MKFKITLIVLAASSLLIFACSTNLYIPTAENVVPNSNIATLAQGRSLMMDKCSSCHGIPKPEKYSAEQWVKIMDKMAPKAKLQNDQKTLILNYATKGAK